LWEYGKTENNGEEFVTRQPTLAETSTDNDRNYVFLNKKLQLPHTVLYNSRVTWMFEKTALMTGHVKKHLGTQFIQGMHIKAFQDTNKTWRHIKFGYF
jgi:hypothetical protein